MHYAFLSLHSRDAESLYSKLSRKLDNRMIVRDSVYVGWNRYMLQQGNYFYGFSHYPYHKIKLPEKTFSFTIFRDPASRVVSLYKMLKHLEKYGNYHPFYKKNKKWIGNGFDEFVGNIPKKQLSMQLYMFSKNYDVDAAMSNVANLSYYFFLEDFEKGIKKLSKLLKLPLKTLHERVPVLDFQADEAALKKLRSKLKEEYELYDRLRQRVEY